jgi:hypothetical protein
MVKAFCFVGLVLVAVGCAAEGSDEGVDESAAATSEALTVSGYCKCNGNKLTGYCVNTSNGSQLLDTAECPTGATAIALKITKMRLYYDSARPCSVTQ